MKSSVSYFIGVAKNSDKLEVNGEEPNRLIESIRLTKLNG